jgi:uncharacterized protein YndB with AHSA1/START domain
MATIHVETTIDAPVARVWAAVEDISTHVRWMEDARAIRFLSERRSGVGTSFACDTQIGPFRLTDDMEIVEWNPPTTMAVRHRLPVHGTGRFVLTPVDGGRTVFAWREELAFPWWMGGGVGEAVAAPIMGWVWRRSLHNLRNLVESERAW